MGQDQCWKSPSKSRKRRLTVQVCEVLQGLGGCVGEAGWTPSKSRKRRLTVQVCEVLQGLGGCVGEAGFGIGRSQGEVEGPQGR